MKFCLLRYLKWCGAALLLLSAAGCATQSYGRMPALSDAEQENLSCPAIAVELRKVSDYRKNVALQGTMTSGSDVVGFLTDFGVGNTGERGEALTSADKRIKQLRALWAKKRCT